jgi:hypothetical protein
MVEASNSLLLQMFGLMVASFQPPLHSMGSVEALHVLVVDSCQLLTQLLRLMTLQQDLTVVSVVLTDHYN